jgi:hypothetical protein
MAYYTNKTVNSACTANITSSRNRLKIYGNNVYLKDGQNFEIELYNPTQSKVLAKIEINGKLMSQSGIVLRPGERVYLERFIDTNNKLLFETYEVENSEESKRATEKNGLIEVLFYDEYTPTTWITNSGTGCGRLFGSGDYYYTTNSPATNIPWAGTTFNYTSNSVSASIAGSFSCSTSNKSKETGRVEMGESSSQSFTTVDGSFNWFSSKSVAIKILPESYKPLDSRDLRRNYCPGCGTRVRKQSWKFCPNCGEKL